MKDRILWLGVLVLMFVLTGVSPAENRSTANIPGSACVTLHNPGLFSPSNRENGVLSVRSVTGIQPAWENQGSREEWRDQATLECPPGCETRCHWNGNNEWICVCVCKPMM